MKALFAIVLVGLALPSAVLVGGPQRESQPQTPAVETGSTELKADPRSLELLLTRIEVLKKENRVFDLRKAIHEAFEMAPEDEAVLRGAAYAADIFGDRAAEAYERWASALESGRASPAEIKNALTRGLIVAFRDGESATAARISERLTRLDETGFGLTPSPASIEKNSSDTVVPGGRRALAQILSLNPSQPPGRFIAEYSRVILRVRTMPAQEREAIQKSLRLYFSTVAALKTFGKKSGDGVDIVLDLHNSDGIAMTSEVLRLLGWQIRPVRTTFLIELSAGEDAVIRQSFASALGIDELAMKTELEEKQAFIVKLRDDRETLIFDDAYWIGLLKNQGNAASFVEAAFQNVTLPQLYVGFAGMSAETRRFLIEALDQEELTRRAPQLAVYGSSIVIDSGRVVLPGGVQVAGSWSSFTKVNPGQPAPFVRNLVRKDGGKLLAYYYAIANLPERNQRFFTSTARRLSSFYQVFPFEDEVAIDHDAFVRRDDVFVRLARELRFNEDGSIRFPGSARVWMIANGSSENADAVQALFSRIDRAKPPDSEDEILLAMLDRKYDRGVQKVSQIENFLAVSHIESHRTEPLDERTALALSQIHPKYHSVFPYFAALPSLRSDAIDAFQRAAEQLEKFEGVPLNTALGEFHALVQLTIIFHELGLLSDDDTAQLFTSICVRMSSIRKQEDLGAAGFEAIEKMLQRSGRSIDVPSDEFFLHAVAGEIDAADFSQTTTARIREVLRLQSIGSLDPLLKIYRAASALSRGEPARWEDVEENVERVTEIKEEAGDELPKAFRRDFMIGDPDEVSAIVATLKAQLAAKKPLKDVEKTAARLIDKLNPFLKTTLVGWVYAYYFSPRDLAIASDRYLVRRHTFYDVVTRDYWPGAQVAQYSGTIRGSYLRGGFAELAAAAGMIAKTNVQARDSIQPNNYVTATSAQLAAVRSVPWRRVTDMGMHSVALKLRLAREFVVRSAFDPDMLKELEVATRGLIGAGRRFELVDALANRDFASALRLLSSGDLYFLADALMKLPEYEKLNGPVRSSFEITGKELSVQHHYFGGFHRMTLACAHPHLVRLAPFEEYENDRMLEPLAERLSDILLDLAEAADRDGFGAQALARLAEPAVRQYSARIAGYGQRDWMSAIERMRSVDLKILSQGLKGIE